jgi:large subunit ribosomal protein L10
MKREDKSAIIDQLTDQIKKYPHFYLTDISELNAATTSQLRRRCFKENIELVVVKNTLLEKAFDNSNIKSSEFAASLKGHTAVMFTEIGNGPAKLIKDFRKKNAKPILKGAYVEECVYLGDNQLDALCSVKSKLELIGDIVGLLQSPAKTVISQLQSGGAKIHGVLETLSKKE